MPVGYTPIYRITKDDLDITNRFNDRMLSIKVELSGGNAQADTMSISLDNADFKLATPSGAGKIKIELGYKEIGLADQGTYEINDYEFRGPPHSLIITGNSVGFKSALKAPAFQAHDNRTVGDLIGEIASKGGATPRVSPELAGERVTFFNQSMSPLHMLHELERRFGAMAKFENGFLIFKPRGTGETYKGTLQPILVLEPHMFAAEDGYSVRFSDRTTYARTIVPWLDRRTGKTHWEGQDNPNYRAGTSAQQTYKYEKMMNSQDEARKMAKSVMDMLRRQELEANFKLAKGDPWIRDQMPIIVEKMFDPINGQYIAENVTHTFVKGSGIQTSIQARLPNMPKPFKLVDAASLGLDALNSIFNGP